MKQADKTIQQNEPQYSATLSKVVVKKNTQQSVHEITVRYYWGEESDQHEGNHAAIMKLGPIGINMWCHFTCAEF